ncbi:hypothetical protein H1S01_10235 [Heliobacterium chlorum]|uniref:rRNA methylase n=1 Tax=Heliobacterium chlorum TaxID=2698 RepID=A0ABR7T3W0_HELCL|nr:hypothetical protein [Heliobacterium chlorum]
MNSLTSAVTWSRRFLTEIVQPGDFVIDGTAGNGQDTLFLAEQVLPGGKVWAFDIQQKAIDATAARLKQSGYEAALWLTSSESDDAELHPLNQLAQAMEPTAEHGGLSSSDICLFRCDHSRLAALLKAKEHPPLKGAIFNLGYLPGGDHAVVTQAETTVAALEALAEELAFGGRIVVVVYVGHEGAEGEAAAVGSWWRNLSPKAWDTVSIQYPNRTGRPPYVLVAEKKPLKGGCR